METRQNDSQNRRRTSASGRAASGSRNPTRRTASTGQRPASGSQRAAYQRSSAQRSASRQAASRRGVTAQRRRRTGAKKRSAAPDVVYTPAAPFSRGQLLVRLVTVAAVVMALMFGISIFFHVETIKVSGAEKYEPWTIVEASGLKEGDNLLTVSDAQISGNIIARLPYVKNVRVGIKLPDTVNIYIEEQDVVYAIRDTGNLWWLITGDGTVVENTDLATAGEYPQILGVNLYKATAGQAAVAEEPEPETPTDSTAAGETTPAPVTILGAQRLSTALDIVQYLEEYKLIDRIVSVDVSDMGNILVSYGQQYQINLGDTTELKYKVEMVAKGIPKLDEEYSNPVGTIDATLRLDNYLVFTFETQTEE